MSRIYHSSRSQLSSSLWRLLPLTVAFLLLFPISDATRTKTRTKCIQPVGIDDPSFRAKGLSSKNFNLPDQILVQTILKHYLDPLVKLETPIQFRAVQLIISTFYGFAAAFHPVALDNFGRRRISDSRRRCQPTFRKQQDRFQLHRKVSLAYTVLFAGDIVAGVRQTVCDDLTSWGLPCDICDKPEDCQSTDTPWGLGYNLASEIITEFSRNDGWNADGSLSRSHNKIPFQDWRDADAYTPVNRPWEIQNITRWQPLLESDGKGFLFYQDHVVPHIGESALSILLGDREICKLNAPAPNYDLLLEARLALERSGRLNDVLKSEIVLFDGKLISLFPLQVQYFQRAGVDTDSFEFIAADAYIINCIYEATLVVWRQKVLHDLIRPPSLIHEMLRDSKVHGYAGPGEGTGQILAQDWEPYIRTMPHAEYPSGSACVCKTFEKAMQILTGSDDVDGAIGGPLILEVKAGSSPVEPGVPSRDLKLEYSSWSEVRKVCSESRLNGGMHFTGAVSAGEELCAGIPGIIAKAFEKLREGRRPKYVASSKGARNARKKRCSQYSN